MAESIRGINVRIGAETTGLQKALKDVNKNARDIGSELRQVNNLLKFNPGDTKLLAQQQELLAKQVDNSREKLDRLKASEQQVRDQFSKGEISDGQMRAFERELVKTESQLKHYESQLTTTISKTEQFAKKMQEAGEKLQSAGKKMTDIGKNLSMKVTAPIVAMGAAITKVGMDFEAAMSEVAAISGATGEELGLLTEKAKEMGATTKFSASESAEALKYMAMAGWDTQQMLDGISGVMDLAAASGENLGTVSDIVTDAITAFGMEAAQAGEFADVLAAASSNANTNVSMLGESFKYVAPVFGSFGYSAEDAALALGLMANAGIKSSQAGTTLRSALTRLSKPTGEAAGLIQKLGIQLTNAQGNMLPFESVMQQLRTTFQNLTTEQQAQYAATIFGQQSMSGMLAIINASEKDYQKLTSAINESTGAAKTMANEMQDNLSGRLTVLKSSIEGVALQLFDAMIPALESIVGAVQKAVNAFSNLSPSMQKTIVITAGIATAAGPVLVVLGSIVSAIGTLLPLLGAIGAAIAGISAPVVAVVAGIAAFAAIAIEVYRNWDEVKTALINIWELIKASAKGLVTNIQLGFTKMKATVLEVVDAIISKLSVLEKLPFGVGEKFAGLGDSVGEAAEKARAEVDRLAKEAEARGEDISEAVEATKLAFGDMGTAVAGDVKGVISAITSQTKEIEEQTYKQVEVVEEGQKQQSAITLNENQYRTDVTAEEEEEQTEITAEEAEKRTQLREEFEQKWNDKLFDLTSERIDQINKQEEEALAKAEELEADKTAIKEYYALKRQEIATAEADAIEKIEEQWNQKLFKQTASQNDILDEEEERAIARAKELGADTTAIKAYYANERQKIIDKEIEADEKKIEVKEELEKTWNDKLYNLTHSRLEILAKEREQTIAEAEEKGAEVNAIEETYAIEALNIIKDQKVNSIEELKQQKEEALRLADELGIEKSRIIELYSNKAVELFNAEKVSTLEELQDQKEQTLLKYEELGLKKTAIIQYYADEQARIEEEALAEKKARADEEDKILNATVNAWTDSYMSIVNSLVEGSKTIKEVLKEVVIAAINALEKEVMATQMAELAKAWAQSWWDWSSVGRALASIAASKAAFEGAKALVRGLETGGVVAGGSDQLFRLGDGKEDEAVVPLNERVLGNLGASIAKNMPQQQAVSQRPIEVKLQIGTLVADDLGLKKLERSLQKIRVGENIRLGVST